MKKLLILVAFAAVLSTGCRKIEVDGDDNTGTTPPPVAENTILEGRITESRTLKASNTYKLRGLVYVTNGAILTIEPGTKIVGETGKNGALVITRSAKIMADGTQDKPIVFTSEAATPQRGDWAGLVILGNAPNNTSFNGVDGIGEIEGGINNSDGLGLYGLGATSNLADNSGILRYVRIEYAGYAFLPDKEINGLTFGGVGNQTVVDYVQVSYSNDDAFEWFGGSVNCKHLIAFRTLDDDFDTDNGFSGKIQFGISLRDSSIADISKSEAFESDNDANGSDRMTYLPSIPVSAGNPVAIGPVKTSCVFSNMTVIGPKATSTTNGNSLFLSAAQIRRNSEMSIFNSVIMGWGGGSVTGLFIDASKGTATDKNLDPAGGLNFKNNIIAGPTDKAISYAAGSPATGATTASITAWVNTPAYGNILLAANTDVQLTAPFNYTAPDFNPATGSPAASGADFSSAKLKTATAGKADFSAVTYKGACSVGDSWWKTWTSFK
jgi:hypothetical protein